MTCIAHEGGPLSLFEYAAEHARARLAASALGGLLPGEKVADLFCGAGGWGEGGKLHGLRVDFAINHSPEAITTHARNNPGCRHHLGDAWKARPRDVIGPRTRLGLLLASAACTTHSRAKGSAPVSKRVHMLGWCIARWMEEASPRLVMIENVPEWRDWGPLVPRLDERGREVRDAQGRVVMVHDRARKGQHFRRWWRYCERLGYVMEQRVLDAPDYGEASRRRRLFVIARRDGQPIVWPEVTHGSTTERGGVCQGNGGDAIAARCGEGRPGQLASGLSGVSGGEDRRGICGSACGDGARNTSGSGGRTDRRSQHGDDGVRRGGWTTGRLHPLRTAADIIDWSDLGRSIFGRRQALKPKTQARIAEGIRRYVIADADPFVLGVTQTGGGWAVSSVDDPLPTQTTRQDLAVCSPVIAPQNSGVFGQRSDQPGPTITQKGHQAVTVPVMATTRNGEREGQAPRCHPVTTPAMTVTGGSGQGVATPVCIHAHHGGGQATRADAAVPAITSGGVHANLATPLLMNNTSHHTGGRADGPVPTVTTGGQVALVAPLTTDYYGSASTAHHAEKPLGTVTTLDRHGLVGVVLGLSAAGAARALETAAWLRKHLGDAVPVEEDTGLAYTVIGGVRRYFVDILFRMLRPLELAAAMGFPADYEWPRTRTGTINQRAAVRMIGNAVSVRTARALIAGVLPRGAAKRKAVRA